MYYHELNLALSIGCRTCQLCNDGIRITTGNAIKCFNIACTKYYVPVSHMSRTIAAMTCNHLLLSLNRRGFFVCTDVLWVILGVSVKSGSNYKLSCFMKLCPLSGGKYLFKF
jgi:hypothetical protein